MGYVIFLTGFSLVVLLACLLWHVALPLEIIIMDDACSVFIFGLATIWLVFMVLGFRGKP